MSFVLLLLSVLNFVQVRMIQWQGNVAVKTCLNFSQRHFPKSGRRRHHCFIQFYCLFYSVLLSFALSSRRRDVKTVTWLPSVALAGSNLLRERSRGEDALQLLVTTKIKSSGS